MRWKAYFFNKHNDRNKKKSDPIIIAFRLKSRKSPPQIPETLPKKINMEAKRIVKKFSIDDKMEIMAQQQCFVTIKDHKEDFR